jgi:methylated-DNA-protein-cysteine methyltransferase-like protein
MGKSNAWEEVYEIVQDIPPGTVMTYGQIAKLCQRPLTPRSVGWAMHDCPENVPWHRVVNSKGGCSTDALPDSEPGRQRRLLEAEGIEFRASGTLDLNRYGIDIDDGTPLVDSGRDF